MNVRVHYGRLVIGNDQARLALTAPVDDLLAVRLDDDGQYVDFLHERYRAFLPRGLSKDRLREELADWQAHDQAHLLEQAATKAQRGTFEPALGDDLARVKYRPGDDPDDVPAGDLPALAAWALVETMRREPFTVRRCKSCGHPFLATGRNRYCERPALGRKRDCRSLQRDLTFGRDHADYRKEYKRLTEAVRRGRSLLTRDDLEDWRAENSPDDWQPYEEWIGRRSARTGERGATRRIAKQLVAEELGKEETSP